jgi:hypothetical protein
MRAMYVNMNHRAGEKAMRFDPNRTAVLSLDAQVGTLGMIGGAPEAMAKQFKSLLLPGAPVAHWFMSPLVLRPDIRKSVLRTNDF